MFVDNCSIDKWICTHLIHIMNISKLLGAKITKNDEFKENRTSYSLSMLLCCSSVSPHCNTKWIQECIHQSDHLSLSSQLPYSFIKKNSFWKSKLNPLTLQAYAILLWRPIPVLAPKSSCFKNTSQIGCRLKLQFSGLLQRCVVLLSSILRIMNTHSSNPPLLSLWMTQLFFLQMLEWINISLSSWDRFYCEIASDS